MLKECIDKVKGNIAKTYLNIKLNKIGKASIENDKLLCIVDVNKMWKEFPINEEKSVELKGETNKKILKLLGIKKVTYLFSECTIPGPITLLAPGSNVKFANCSFVNSVDVIGADELTFEGDICLKNYYAKNKVSLLGNPKKLNFYNTKISIFPFIHANLFFESNNVSIMDSEFELGCFSEFNLKGSTLDIINSKLNMSTLFLKLDNLMCDNSEIEATTSTRIEVEECMDLDVIKSKSKYINGTKVISIIEAIEEQTARNKLIKTLKEFSLECQKLNIDTSKKVEEANQMVKKNVAK